MLITTCSYFALTMMALAAVLHVVRTKGGLSDNSGLTSASGMIWIITAVVIIGSMIDQATQHPESTDPPALICGSIAAALALLFGLDALVRAIVASDRHVNPTTTTTDEEFSASQDPEPPRMTTRIHEST